jgi:5-methylcytosine-specific restriction endonuclease McrA
VDIHKTSKEIAALYNNRCIVNPVHEYATIHEIVPRSKRPRTWKHDENRVPVCASCHDEIHRTGAMGWVEKLRRIQAERLDGGT